MTDTHKAVAEGAQAWASILNLAREWPQGTMVKQSRDGFQGVVIGYYTTLEKRAGLVVQYTGTKIVHVYHTQWLEKVND